MSRTAAIRVAAFSITVALAGAALGQTPTYDLEVLDSPPGVPARVWAVNDHGVVVGDYWFPNGDHPPVVMPPGGSMTFLPLLPGAVSGTAMAVTNAGVIGGVSFVVTPQGTQGRACLWSPTPTGYSVSALPATAQGVDPMLVKAMNEVGDVVGSLTTGAGFVWSASTGTVALETLALQWMSATDVNELRQVVGGKMRIDLDTSVVEIGAIPAPVWNFVGVNDSGVCAAMSEPVGSPQFKGGTYEFGVGPTDHGAGPPFGKVSGIDYAGTFVGENHDGLVHFEDFGEFPIDSLLDPSASAWTLDLNIKGAVSANGRIAAWATNTLTNQVRAVLLTPQRFHAILETVPGVAGPPVLTGEGLLAAGSPITLRLKRAAPSAPVALIAGLAPANLAFYGGTLVPTPTLVLTGFTTDANGKLTLATTWPAGLPSGTKVYVQDWIADAAAPFGVAGSNALECVVP